MYPAPDYSESIQKVIYGRKSLHDALLRNDLHGATVIAQEMIIDIRNIQSWINEQQEKQREQSKRPD